MKQRRARARLSQRRCAPASPAPYQDWLAVVVLVAERAAAATGGRVTVLLPDGQRRVFGPESRPRAT